MSLCICTNFIVRFSPFYVTRLPLYRYNFLIADCTVAGTSPEDQGQIFLYLSSLVFLKLLKNIIQNPNRV